MREAELKKRKDKGERNGQGYVCMANRAGHRGGRKKPVGNRAGVEQVRGGGKTDPEQHENATRKLPFPKRSF